MMKRLIFGSVVLVVAALAMVGSASAETISFTKQGCEVWTAPTKVLVQVAAVGSAGGAGEAPGGRGDGMSGTIERNAGEDLYVCVDEGGGLSYADSGGGWSGAIFGNEESHAHVAVLAAGGGGAGNYESGSTIEGAGGDAGKPGVTLDVEGVVCLGGGAGTESTVGAAGTCSEGQRQGIPGSAGGELQGGEGHGPAPSAGGGGGGGGYYGGGGAGTLGFIAGGGGGGSDFCGNGTVECTVNAGVGTVFGAGAGANEAHVTLTTTPAGTPTVSKVTTTSGPASGDKAIVITGTNFTHVQSVSFGGVAASTYFTNNAGTEIAVLSPPSEVVGTVDVTVTTIVGTSATTTKDHYKYVPVITEISPASGPTTGISEWGDEVIRGYGFSPGFPTTTQFSYGTTPVNQEDVSCFSSIGCEVWVPAHAAGKVKVKVTVNGITSASSKAATFTYK